MLDSVLHEQFLLRYEVEASETSFLNFNKSVTVHFFDENNKKTTSIKYGLISPEELFELIEKGEEVNINQGYVKNFSLSDYRTKKGYDHHKIIKIKNISAKKCFFDCDLINDFSYAKFEGDNINFNSSIFANGTTTFLNADFGHGDVTFKKSKFGSGSVIFKSTRFGDGSVTFNETNFGNGNISFADADFGNGNVDFKNTRFGNGSIDFKFAKFSKGDLSFEKTIFGRGKKDFKNVEFGGGKIDFKRIEFNDGDVSFEGVEFGDGKVSFRSSVFGHGHKSFELADFANGEAQFDLVEFGSGTLSFNKTKASHISFNDCHFDCYTDMRFERCDFIDLNATIVRDILDMTPQTEKVVIKEINMVGLRILGRIFIDWRANDVYDLIYNQTNSTLFQKAEQFRILKENFRNNGQYDDEDAAYVEFRRCEAKAKLHESLSKKNHKTILAYPNYYFQKYVFDFIGRYATAPTRVLINMLIAVLLFGVFYYVITEYFPEIGTVATTLPAEFNHLHEFWNCNYYSAITFFTIGYGDYFPEGYLKPFAALEGFTGVFLMSYFTVAFVRKILR